MSEKEPNSNFQPGFNKIFDDLATFKFSNKEHFISAILNLFLEEYNKRADSSISLEEFHTFFLNLTNLMYGRILGREICERRILRNTLTWLKKLDIQRNNNLDHNRFVELCKVDVKKDPSLIRLINVSFIKDQLLLQQGLILIIQTTAGDFFLDRDSFNKLRTILQEDEV